ncbi:hypothetical protein [Pedobacter sp. KLB.chiD]|uniref:hypothetical protein n=1 Tax=Pedobacter sp. KLB.chiD TaxID=3387402 RepID=UPI0039999D39
MKQVLSLIFLILCCSSLYAQIPPAGTGCYFNGRLYYHNVQATPTFGLNYRYQYDSNYYYELTCTDNQYAILGGALTTGFFNTPVNCGTSSSYFANTGVMYYYNVVNCGLDYLIPFLLLPLSVAGAVFIKRSVSVTVPVGS